MGAAVCVRLFGDACVRVRGMRWMLWLACLCACSEAGVCACVAGPPLPPAGCPAEPSIGDCLAQFTVRRLAVGWGERNGGWVRAWVQCLRCDVRVGRGACGAVFSCALRYDVCLLLVVGIQACCCVC
jgi:hypothetical protein